MLTVLQHEDASLLELFYDLFFAANYTVFCETQGVNSADRFKAYVGYFTYETEFLYNMMKLTLVVSFGSPGLRRVYTMFDLSRTVSLVGNR